MAIINMSNLYTSFFKAYKLKPREITDTHYIHILELLIEYFDEIRFYNQAYPICNYSMLSEIPMNVIRDDEEFDCQGMGWSLKEVILSQCLHEDVLNNEGFVEEVQYALKTKWERFVDLFKY